MKSIFKKIKNSALLLLGFAFIGALSVICLPMKTSFNRVDAAGDDITYSEGSFHYYESSDAGTIESEITLVELSFDKSISEVILYFEDTSGGTHTATITDAQFVEEPTQNGEQYQGYLSSGSYNGVTIENYFIDGATVTLVNGSSGDTFDPENADWSWNRNYNWYQANNPASDEVYVCRFVPTTNAESNIICEYTMGSLVAEVQTSVQLFDTNQETFTDTGLTKKWTFSLLDDPSDDGSNFTFRWSEGAQASYSFEIAAEYVDITESQAPDLETLPWYYSSDSGYMMASNHDQTYDFVISATIDKAIYDKTVGTLELRCTVFSAEQGNMPESYIDAIFEITYTLSDRGSLNDGKWTFADAKSNITMEMETLEIESNLVFIIGWEWDESEQQLIYHYDAENEAEWNIDHIKYHTEGNRNEFVLYMDVVYEGTHIFPDFDVIQINSPEFGEEPTPGDSTINTIVNGWSDKVGTDISLVCNANFAYITDFWSYSCYDQSLIYTNPDDIDLLYTLRSVSRDDNSTYTLTYVESDDEQTITITEASYNEETLSGKTSLNGGSAISVTLLISQDLMPSQQDDYDEGLNYVESSQSMIYYDPSAEYQLVLIDFLFVKDTANGSNFYVKYRLYEDGTEVSVQTVHATRAEYEFITDQNVEYALLSGLWDISEPKSITLKLEKSVGTFYNYGVNVDPNTHKLLYVEESSEQYHTSLREMNPVYSGGSLIFDLCTEYGTQFEEVPTMTIENCEISKIKDGSDPFYIINGFYNGEVVEIWFNATTTEIEGYEDPPIDGNWDLEQGYLVWIEDGKTFYPEFTRATIYENPEPSQRTCVAYATINGNEESVTIGDPRSSEVSADGTTITGYCYDVNQEIEIIVLGTVDVVEYEEETKDSNPGWNYVDGELYWCDSNLERCDFSLISATKFTDENSNPLFFELEFVIYDVVGPDAGQDEHIETITLTNFSIVREPDTTEEILGLVTGYFGGLDTNIQYEILEYSSEIIRTEKGTITPEQKDKINELLPDDSEQERKDRAAESMQELSQEAAHEILSAVDTYQADIEAEYQKAIQSGMQEDIEKAEAVKQEKTATVQVITEAAVIVGAGSANAEEEAKVVEDVLPEDHGLEEDLNTTLSEFYQKQMDYLLDKEAVPDNIAPNRGVHRTPEVSSKKTNLDSVSKDEYKKMVEFVDVSVKGMKDAALQIRKCSGVKMKQVINDYIQTVKISVFRFYDKAAADEEYVKQAHDAIMFTMQQQVIDALEKNHRPSNNQAKEAQYQEQLDAVKDIITFEEIVSEVLRLKYVSITKKDIEIDEFKVEYSKIFRAWALNDESLNPTGITLEELTTATIETTTKKATKMTYNAKFSKGESIFLIAMSSAVVLTAAGGITATILIRRKRRGLAK